jgi:predicted DNA-binding transcriptional regulator YafY
MRRADRLFQIVLLLGRGRVVTARRMAEELEVSERTVYRDITDLMAAGTPIDGEAGVGYRLRPGYQVPPLMFDGEELEALALGAGMVRAWADTDLARAAGRVLAKVDAVLPDRLRGRWDKETLLAPDFFISPATVTGMPQLRKAIDQRLLVHMAYERDGGETSERVVWPLGLVFWGTKWTLGAWCELRSDFRTFRLDRIRSLELLPSQFPDMAGRRFKDYIAHASGE